MTPLEALRSLAHRVLGRLGVALRPTPVLVPVRVEATRRRRPGARPR
jgi:hypothetical protein